jgi:outer membrane protein assembly factor BamE (lipoprotein component of BamABCDE complex)
MNKILYITFIILITTSCSLKPIDNYHGVAFLEKKQEALLINKSNKNDIIKILGPPSTQSILEDDLWIYIENRKTKSSLLKLGKEITISSNVLV